ncbi:MAG TPA: HEPN domain-containing protein [Acidimicrobiales bacterium]|nr:HEPN domain-containing protein [Acidimicrobiales bacterium]
MATLPDEQVIKQLLPDPEGWADAAKKSRNLVAHGGESSTDLHLMYAITEVTIAVVIVALLHQLRIPTDRVIYALTTTGRLTRAARLANEHWPAVSAQG